MREFHKVARASDVPAGGSLKVEIAGRAIALFCLDGRYHAIPDKCPHRGGSLSEGSIAGTKVSCPWHGWTYDVTNGQRAGFPEGMGKLECFQVKVEGEDLLVEC